MERFLASALLGDVPHGFSTSQLLETADILPGGQLVTVRQVHGVEVVNAADAVGKNLEADAIVSKDGGLLLGIVTADCAPVLLADRRAGVIGAAHAGWRGALGGVLENTVSAMVALGAQRADIEAAVGPTIAQASYEVDQAFRDRFPVEDARFFTHGRTGHWQFDLPAYAAHRLAQAGVGEVDALGEDTYTQPERFHSYRRATHQGHATEGRQLSVIGLDG